MNAEELQEATGCTVERAMLWAGPITTAMEKGLINTPMRQVMFLATVAVESQGFSRQRENLWYTTAKRLLEIFGRRIRPEEAHLFLAKPEALANRVYADREGNGDEASGDGYRYRAGGPIGLTFANNYREFAEASGFDVLEHPEMIETPEVGAAAAAWFWRTNACNKLADDGNFQGVSAQVNTGNKNTPPARINGYPERVVAFNRARRAMGVV